ncbi:hypothetical protein [Natronorubrum halophilum]|uniref:hypothetical protein n=1 Tax=Natronorubrum halophilum TaxID=1702106 RepID=UPI0010C197DC|nr:hypothetical protein [Natronorubrum halophilum]
MTLDEDLVEAVESIPDADPDSIAQYDDDRGHFLIHSDADDQDVDEIDEILEDAGYERDGYLPAPDMVQQNFSPIEDGKGGGSA